MPTLPTDVYSKEKTVMNRQTISRLTKISEANFANIKPKPATPSAPMNLENFKKEILGEIRQQTDGLKQNSRSKQTN